MQSLTGFDLEALSSRAAASPRLRANQNFHPDLTAAVQRLAIAMEPGTYVRPHRHTATWELLCPLRGSFDLILFDEQGVVSARHRLGSDGAAVFEMPAATWHSVISLDAGGVIFEVKEGPYQPMPQGDFAAWSPAEGDDGVAAMMDFLAVAGPGMQFAAP
jgi:cupin fold WbuC family metalloprotein